MDVLCPKCQKNNDIKLEAKLICEHCNEEIDKYNSKSSETPKWLVTILLTTGLLTQAAYHFRQERYPIKTEYAIIESCVDLDSRQISISAYQQKREMCLCALEEAQSDIDYSTFKKEPKEFVRAFTAAKTGCSDD